MIVTVISDLAEQVAQTPNMQSAVAFLQQLTAEPLPDGRIEIEPLATNTGSGAYALVQSYETHGSTEWHFEGHRKYIDIQYILAGEEVIGWAHIADITITNAYDPAKDAWLGTAPADKMVPVRLQAGQLAVFYPSDAHAPRHASESSGLVRKVIIKVGI